MFRRILIANRGEVAARIIKTCRSMGIETVAVYSKSDADLSYLQNADFQVEIGGVRSYLDMDAILHAAKSHQCAAIHPGWGFLSENPTFAARTEALGITFVGPSSYSMRLMSDKAQARRTMKALGLSPIPGHDQPILSVSDALSVAQQIGYPVLLKAIAGGGGRGMRKVFAPEELASAFQEASAEARSAFGNGDMYMEHLIQGGRHIEFQVLADGISAKVLGARECSIQRRHQKLLEETPSAVVLPAQVEELSAVIERVCVALKYRGAGTIEMLRDISGKIYFMEMNTRLQVEHTVTEETWGIDLVEQQLRIAANQPLNLSTEPSGHSIQCRINAEDVDNGFRPVPGKITKLRWPTMNGVRIDTHLSEGDKVSPHYDSMIAKVIVWAPTRAEAIAKMDDVLAQTIIEGVPTTIAVHRKILAKKTFIDGQYDTRFLETGVLQ